MNALEKFKRVVRWHCWANSKAALFFTCLFYLVLKQSLYSTQSILDVLIFLGFILLTTVYGYLMNDLCDIKIDLKHGKQNVFEKAGKRRGTIIVGAIGLISFCCGTYFKDREYFLVFLGLLFFFATFYSAPPFRFKTRGLAGLIIAFMTQNLLPLIMIFVVFESFGTFDMWILAFFATVSGAALELGHQRYDLQSDRSTGTRTYAVEKGEKKIDSQYKVFIILDMLSMLGIIITFTIALWSKKILMIPHVICIPLVIYFCLSGMVVLSTFKRKKSFDPYFEYGRKDIVNLTFTLFPSFFLPFFLACMLTFLYLPGIVLLITFLVFTYITFPEAAPSAKVKIIINEVKNLLKSN